MTIRVTNLAKAFDAVNNGIYDRKTLSDIAQGKVEPSAYTIHYIDGHDLKYKIFRTIAMSEQSARQNLWDSYTDGDFDHQIINIIKEN